MSTEDLEASIAPLTITLDHTEPAVLRRINVPYDIRLDRLHLTLQAAFGWTNSHLWEIRTKGNGRGGIGWGIPDPDWPDGPLNAKKATLWDVIEDTGANTLLYLYDFGDGWEHTIKIAPLIDAEPQIKYPILVDATGRCPPEDIGGPWGYGDFLEAINDPAHERYEELKDWWPEDFDPADTPVKNLKAAVAKLAKTWNRTPKKKKTK